MLAIRIPLATCPNSKAMSIQLPEVTIGALTRDEIADVDAFWADVTGSRSGPECRLSVEVLKSMPQRACTSSSMPECAVHAEMRRP